MFSDISCLIRLPPAFDASVYLSHAGNKDLVGFSENQALNHYQDFGINEGRICSVVNSRSAFLQLIPREASILEVGPFFSPAFRRPEYNVRYIDCLSGDELRSRATLTPGADPGLVPEIDYVWQGQPYCELIDERFEVVFSSHNIEHQPCLVTHLNDLSSVLLPGGAVFLAVPDKRYCFDHFLPSTQLPDVLQAWVDENKRPGVKEVLEHHFFTTHNDPLRHWQGDYGRDALREGLENERIDQLRQEIEALKLHREYIDVHMWKFEPANFTAILDALWRLRLTDLRLVRLYPTVKDSNEFYAVLSLDADARSAA